MPHRRRLFDQRGECKGQEHDHRGHNAKNKHPCTRPGLGANAEMTRGHEREDDQRNRASDRGDGVQVESDGQHDRRGKP
jgi:hypothetical protein